MNYDRGLARAAGITALVAAVAQIADFAVVLVVGGLSNIFTDPLSIFGAGPLAPGALHWSALLSMLGYDLLLLPLVLYLWARLRPASGQTTLVDLYAVCGVLYVLIAAIGAAMLAVVHPYLMVAYATATPAQRDMLAITLLAFHNAIAYGLWNSLETIPVGVWLLGTGLLLAARERALGTFTAVLGAIALLIWVTAALDFRAIPFLTLWAILLTVWTIWAGLVALRPPADAKR